MRQRQIFDYVEPDGSRPVIAFIRQLENKLQQKVWIQLSFLERSQCELQPPLVKSFRQSRHKGLFELRVKLQRMVRIIFLVDTRGRVILLHGFIKKKNRATEQALETAGARKLALSTGKAGIKETTTNFIQRRNLNV